MQRSESHLPASRRKGAKAIKLNEGDNVVLKNGKKGTVLELGGFGSTEFCIDYSAPDVGTEWVPISSVVSKS